MRTFDKYLKHMGSCLPDAAFRVTVDDDQLLCTITSDAFDSHLVGCLVTQTLPQDHGIVAYRDDDQWVRTDGIFALRIRIGGEGGTEFDACVVRLAAALGRGVAVSLTPRTS